MRELEMLFSVYLVCDQNMNIIEICYDYQYAKELCLDNPDYILIEAKKA